MSRYIDADELKEECFKFANDVSRSTMAFVQGQINAAPTADVVEVRHGEWELHGNDDDLGSTYWCSHCYYQVDEELFYPNGYAEEKPYKFCPNCGAKMDGERRENGNT